MATNPLDKVYLSQAQLNTLVNGDSITSGSDTYTADVTALYLLDDTSVSYEAQSLSTAQKTQARTNIGAGTSNFSGSYNDLTDKLTFDSTPTAGSTNPVTSEGIKSYVDNSIASAVTTALNTPV